MPPQPDLLSKAQNWFQTDSKLKPSNKSGTHPLLGTFRLPDWQHYQVQLSGGASVIEVPLLHDGNYLITVIEDEETGTKKIGVTRLLLRQNSDESFSPVIMRIFGDSAYLAKEGNQFAHNSFTERESDFSGDVFFYDWEENFLGANRYLNGQFVAKMEANLGKNINCYSVQTMTFILDTESTAPLPDSDRPSPSAAQTGEEPPGGLATEAPSPPSPPSAPSGHWQMQTTTTCFNSDGGGYNSGSGAYSPFNGGTGGGIVAPEPFIAPEEAFLPPPLPPVYDLTSFQQAKTFDKALYNVYIAAQNSSLSNLQKAAWYNQPNGHTVGTSWNTINGIAAEAQVIKELMGGLTGVSTQTFVATGNPFAVLYAKENTEIVHAPDKYTDMVMTVNKNQQNMFFNFSLLDIPTTGVIQNTTRTYQGRTDFVIEVKNLTAYVGNDLAKFKFNARCVYHGLTQLLKNQKVINGNGVPILILEKEAYMKALTHSLYGPGIRTLTRDLKEKYNGGVHLIEGLNSRSAYNLSQMVNFIRQNTTPPPSNYYNGTDEPNHDLHELYN